MTDREIVLDLIGRYGRYQLIAYIQDKTDAEIVDLIERAGDFDGLRDWYAYEHPAHFDPVDGYVDACEAKMNADREERYMTA